MLILAETLEWSECKQTGAVPSGSGGLVFRAIPGTRFIVAHGGVVKGAHLSALHLLDTGSVCSTVVRCSASAEPAPVLSLSLPPVLLPCPLVPQARCTGR